MTVATDGEVWDLEVHPHKATRVSIGVATLVLVIFVVIAALLPDEKAGVSFTGADQWGMAGIGVLLALAALRFTRPRLRVGPSGIEIRGFLGLPRLVEWDLVRGVEFVPKARFARVVLPADETIALLAVQRGDADRSVETMRRLRELYARYASPDSRSPGPSPGASG